MSASLIPGLAALLALLPTLLLGRAGTEHAPRRVFWACLVAFVVGPVSFAALLQGEGWRTGLGPALWLAVAASASLFAMLATGSAAARRLAPLLAAYLLLVGILALAWQHLPSRPLRSSDWPAWLPVHIAVAVIAYGLLTIAAVAGTAGVVQERALRRRAPTPFTRSLPSIADGEALQLLLLVAVEVLLGLTVVSGFVVNRGQAGVWLALDHKTILSLLAFAVIGVLLLLHLRLGVSGRRMARFALVAYLLLTLAYPGVKLVTDLLIGPRA
jgi:ABC-type uncharacterized transport system permease subunit